jgi:hypothetical protein
MALEMMYKQLILHQVVILLILLFNPYPANVENMVSFMFMVPCNINHKIE